MGKLTYTGMTSLDGYTEDPSGDFSWAAPDDEVHRLANELTRPAHTHLLGRRMYETMAYWEADDPGRPEVAQEFASIWQAADKVVFSRTLAEPSTARTRIEREWDAEAVRQLKDRTDGEIAIGGPELAAQAIAAGLVDEFQQFVSPIVVGGGKPFLPDGVRIELQLVEERRFESGVVFLRYSAV